MSFLSFFVFDVSDPHVLAVLAILSHYNRLSLSVCEALEST